MLSLPPTRIGHPNPDIFSLVTKRFSCCLLVSQIGSPIGLDSSLHGMWLWVQIYTKQLKVMLDISQPTCFILSYCQPTWSMVTRLNWSPKITSRSCSSMFNLQAIGRSWELFIFKIILHYKIVNFTFNLFYWGKFVGIFVRTFFHFISCYLFPFIHSTIFQSWITSIF
jgi:hypothetical protein